MIEALPNLKLIQLKNIKLIDVSSTGIISLKGLENSANLHGVNISRSPIQNLDGLLNAKNLYCINASACKELENIEGIKNSVKLKEILLDERNGLTVITKAPREKVRFMKGKR